MNEKNYEKGFENAGKAFQIEASINEEGPKKLRVEPGEDSNEFRVYEGENFLTRLVRRGENDWEQQEGDLTAGVAQVIGREISRWFS